MTTTPATRRRGYAETAAGQIHFMRIDGGTGATPLLLLHPSPLDRLSFHHSFAAAKSYVEGERVQGTAWTISEIPCLVATNQRASVFIVEINTDPPFSDLDVQYGSKRSLGSIGECWSRYQERIAGKHVGAGSPIYSFTFLHTHNTPEWKCSCGKSRGKYREGWICNFCGDEVDQEETVCGSYPKPCVRPLKNWSSVSIGSQYHLSWFESPREGCLANCLKGCLS